jgi:hypothetical protein
MKCFPGCYATTEAWGLVGPILCNAAAEMFKPNLLPRKGILLRVSEKQGRGENYDRGIAFQGVARLGIFKRSKKNRAQQDK